MGQLGQGSSAQILYKHSKTLFSQEFKFRKAEQRFFQLTRPSNSPVAQPKPQPPHLRPSESNEFTSAIPWYLTSEVPYQKIISEPPSFESPSKKHSVCGGQSLGVLVSHGTQRWKLWFQVTNYSSRGAVVIAASGCTWKQLSQVTTARIQTVLMTCCKWRLHLSCQRFSGPSPKQRLPAHDTERMVVLTFSCSLSRYKTDNDGIIVRRTKLHT